MILSPLLLLGFLVLLFIILRIHTRLKIFPLKTIPYSKYTLVLGAGLEKYGLPTDILADRVKTAVNLIKAKKTSILILSGSFKDNKYSEPESMKSLAELLGVKASQLVLDLQGKTTFNSCMNLRNINDLNQISLVTQNFHLPRAIFLAEMMGYSANGTPANLYEFSFYKTVYWHIREIFAFPINLIKLLIYRFQQEA
jgi:vancomycin permeability regulator SanA